jgi:hypothetical protein
MAERPAAPEHNAARIGLPTNLTSGPASRACRPGDPAPGDIDPAVVAIARREHAVSITLCTAAIVPFAAGAFRIDVVAAARWTFVIHAACPFAEFESKIPLVTLHEAASLLGLRTRFVIDLFSKAWVRAKRVAFDACVTLGTL